MTARTTLLNIENVSLMYGRRTALDGVSLQVAAGEVVGLVGPNGAGKTSIARLATGFTLPTTGSVTVDGEAARRYRIRRGVGYAPEELPRAGAGTVRALLAIRRDHRGDDGSAAAGPPGSYGSAGSPGPPGSFGGRVHEILGIAPLLDRPVTALSKGQWRAVLLAYATRSRPRLVVLDEPESGLDPGALDRLAALIALLREAGSAVLVLSHQLFEVERSCHRVLFVREGTIAAEEAGGVGGAFLRAKYSEIFTSGDDVIISRHFGTGRSR